MYRKIGGALLLIGLSVLFMAAMQSDAGRPLSDVLPEAVAGVAIMGAGGGIRKVQARKGGVKPWRPCRYMILRVQKSGQ